MLKHIKLIVLTLAAGSALSAATVASAVAATAPDLLQAGKVAIPAGTKITASGTNPVVKGKGFVLKCASVEVVEGGTHGNNAEVVGTSEKEYSSRLLLSRCEEEQTKVVCTTEGQEAGHILTVLVRVKLVSKKVGEKLVGGGITVGSKGGFDEELAKFKCGEKAVTATGCVPAQGELTEESKMGTATSEREAEIQETPCELKVFGSKAEFQDTEKISINKEGKLLTLELVV